MVASSTSGLVDVDTTGPLLAITLGMINEDVFPERGGPRIITDCSGRAKHQPSFAVPEIDAVPGASGCVQNAGEGANEGLTRQMWEKFFHREISPFEWFVEPIR